MFVAYYRRPQILTGDSHSLTKRGYDTGPEVALMKILKSENSNSGASSLLEVLEVQRANNDIYLAHYAAPERTSEIINRVGAVCRNLGYRLLIPVLTSVNLLPYVRALREIGRQLS